MNHSQYEPHNVRYIGTYCHTLKLHHIISTEFEALLFRVFFQPKFRILIIRFLHCLISFKWYLWRENSCNISWLLSLIVEHQTNSQMPKHLSSKWPIYAKNNNNKMLTGSSDKVVSGCLLLYGNVLSVSVLFQA